MVSDDERALRIIAKSFCGKRISNLTVMERNVCAVLCTHDYLTVDEDGSLLATKDVDEAFRGTVVERLENTLGELGLGE